jgi:hypothetical protein
MGPWDGVWEESPRVMGLYPSSSSPSSSQGISQAQIRSGEDRNEESRVLRVLSSCLLMWKRTKLDREK